MEKKTIHCRDAETTAKNWAAKGAKEREEEPGPEFDFPFISRQLEPIFGHSVVGLIQLKTFYLNSERVLGVGWDTALSALILDFTVPGMLILMALFGYVSERVMIAVRWGATFPAVVVLAVLMVQAAYTPYLSAIADTNLLLLLLTCTFLVTRVRAQPAVVAA